MYNANLVGDKNSPLITFIPSQQLLEGSIGITRAMSFTRWTAQNHGDCYEYTQRMVATWKESGIDQHLIYGKVDSNKFSWEIVPYQKCKSVIHRIVQQLVVLWRSIFGGKKISQQDADKQSQLSLLGSQPQKEISHQGNDPFCQPEVIDRQLVLTGKKVNVLFNHAPIGFGGERLHFLVVPKEHRETFTEITKEEYVEALMLTQKLVAHFTESRKEMKSVYLLNKSGVDAGQTVKHWHLQVIFSSNKAQDLWGKLTVFKNILLGSSPMKREVLQRKVNELRSELT